MKTQRFNTFYRDKMNNNVSRLCSIQRSYAVGNDDAEQCFGCSVSIGRTLWVNLRPQVRNLQREKSVLLRVFANIWSFDQAIKQSGQSEDDIYPNGGALGPEKVSNCHADSQGRALGEELFCGPPLFPVSGKILASSLRGSSWVNTGTNAANQGTRSLSGASSW